jgi:hypothetical protein
MVSLWQSKVCAGETQTSVRAITPIFLPFLHCSNNVHGPPFFLQDILKKIYDFNHQSEHWDIKPVGYYRQNKRKDVHVWGGGQVQRMLGAAYALSFLCLLCFDKVLKIQMHHIEFILDTNAALPEDTPVWL